MAAYASSPSATTTNHIRDCMIGLGVSREEAVKVAKPKLAHKAPHGHGEMVTSKAAATKPQLKMFKGKDVKLTIGRPNIKIYEPRPGTAKFAIQKS